MIRRPTPSDRSRFLAAISLFVRFDGRRDSRGTGGIPVWRALGLLQRQHAGRTVDQRRDRVDPASQPRWLHGDPSRGLQAPGPGPGTRLLLPQCRAGQGRRGQSRDRADSRGLLDRIQQRTSLARPQPRRGLAGHRPAIRSPRADRDRGKEGAGRGGRACPGRSPPSGGQVRSSRDHPAAQRWPRAVPGTSVRRTLLPGRPGSDDFRGSRCRPRWTALLPARARNQRGRTQLAERETGATGRSAPEHRLSVLLLGEDPRPRSGGGLPATGLGGEPAGSSIDLPRGRPRVEPGLEAGRGGLQQPRSESGESLRRDLGRRSGVTLARRPLARRVAPGERVAARGLSPDDQVGRPSDDLRRRPRLRARDRSPARQCALVRRVRVQPCRGEDPDQARLADQEWGSAPRQSGITRSSRRVRR